MSAPAASLTAIEKGLRHMVIQIQFRYSQRLQHKSAPDWSGELAAPSASSVRVHIPKA